jgi:hypothetical protein
MAKKKGWESIKKRLPFSVDTTSWLMKNLPFIFFVAFLSFIYIANARYAERKVREIQTVQKDIQRLNWEYLSIKTELMLNSMQSEVSKEAERRNLDLDELRTPPEIIEFSKDEASGY